MNTLMAFPDTVEEFMEQYKCTDTEHIYSNGIEYVPIFRMNQWFDNVKYRNKTNADRIRNMTDEELAKFIYEQADCFCQARFGDCIRDEEHCRKAWLKWLKEDVKE